MKSYVVKDKFSRVATPEDGVDTATIRFTPGQVLVLSDEAAKPLLAAGRIGLESEPEPEKPRKVRYGKPHVPEEAVVADEPEGTGGLQIPAAPANAAVAAAGAKPVPRVPKPKGADAAEA